MEQEFVIPEKSPNDQREYQAIQLNNKLKVLLISDPKAEKAACSIAVGVGSLKDGQRSLGLAHFLEHMLFMGSRKYPRFNEYSQFMSLNSGFDNAYTSDIETNYHFQIANDTFCQAVQRLCDFFVKALLTSSCIQKQRQAVHEQCKLRCSEDNSRKWQILKHFASGPYHNHSIGNNSTLSHPSVEEDLVNFYQNQYSANRITATLLSALPINEMKTKLLPFFEEIQNKNLKEIDYETHFLRENVGKFVRMQSIKDEVLMEFFWMGESVRPFYQWHPEKYICHILGHEGKNSLLSTLKAKDWANSIVSYSHDLPKQTIFGLQLHLTQNGENEYKSVYNLVIDYVSSLQAQKYIYEELSQANAVAFRFKQKGSNFDYVKKLSEDLHRIPMPEILSWKSKFNEYKPEIINKFLDELCPENLIVVYSCVEELENPITEKYLGGKFVFENLPTFNKSGENFQSLIKNPFLPLKTDLVKAEITTPIKENEIWFVQGNFGVCKGGVYLKICKAESEIFLQFYRDYLDLLLKQITYEAQSLKLEVQIDYENQFTISIYGFSHTVQKLIEEISPIISIAHKTPLGQKLFKLALENLEEEYNNFYQGDVDEVVDNLLKIVLKSTGATIEDKISQLEKYNYKAISKRIDDFWKTAKIQWVVAGNFQKNDITKSIKAFQQSVGTNFSSEKCSISCLKLVKQNPLVNITFLESEDIGTSAVIMYKEIGQYSQLQYYTLSLLKNYIETPFFDKLRTEQQLAYYLAAYQENIRGVLSLSFLLISSTAHPKEISGHITTFIQDFLEKIDKDLTEEKFETLKKSLISKTLEPFQSLEDYYTFVYREINKGTYCFDRKTNSAKLNDYLAQIKREDLIKMLRDCLHYNLQIWVVAEPHKKAFQQCNIEGKSVQEIKSSHKYYPDITQVNSLAKPQSK